MKITRATGATPAIVRIGIDPGKSGAVVALVISDHVTTVLSCRGDETITDRLVFLQGVATSGTCVAVMEEVHSMPRQGVRSTFTFGRNVGQWEAILTAAGIPHDFCTPQTWMRALRCLSGGDKNVTKARAQQLYPGVKVSHQLADALLIATYCRMMHR